MVKTQREKFTVAFTNYEADTLNSLQLSYLYGKSRLSLIPSVNEILKATVMHTLFRTENKNVLKGFTNAFLKRRNMGTKEDFDEDEEDYESNRIEERENEIVQMDPEPLQHPRTGNYSFYFTDYEIKRVLELKKRVAELSGIDIDRISNTEIVRETIHFVFGKRVRNLSFRSLSYVGFLYGLSPVATIIAGEFKRGKVNKRALKEHLQYFANERELETLKNIYKDREVADNFLSDFLQHRSITDYSEVKQILWKYYSEIGRFNFYLGMVGAEMTYYTSRFQLSELADAVMVFAVNDHKVSMIKIGAESFISFLEILYDSSEVVCKEYGKP